jgi:hypothetical protein
MSDIIGVIVLVILFANFTGIAFLIVGIAKGKDQTISKQQKTIECQRNYIRSQAEIIRDMKGQTRLTKKVNFFTIEKEEGIAI